jgi:hypothetical protein
MKLTVDTVIDGCFIKQRISHADLISRAYQTIIDLCDAGVHDSLVHLGWTPPTDDASLTKSGTTDMKTLFDVAELFSLTYQEGKILELLLAHKATPTLESKKQLLESVQKLGPDKAKVTLRPSHRKPLPGYGPWLYWDPLKDVPSANTLVAVLLKGATDTCKDGRAVQFNWDNVFEFCFKDV